MVVHVDLPQIQFQNKIATKKTKWQPKHKIDHNPFNFQARNYKFCMVAIIDLPQKNQNQNGCQNTKLTITHSIFQLNTPDFAW